MFRCGDGNAGAGTEHVLCVLRIWEDGGALMEYVVCFCRKVEGRGEGEGREGEGDGDGDGEGQGEGEEGEGVGEGEGDGEGGGELPYQGG